MLSPFSYTMCTCRETWCRPHWLDCVLQSDSIMLCMCLSLTQCSCTQNVTCIIECATQCEMCTGDFQCCIAMLSSWSVIEPVLVYRHTLMTCQKCTRRARRAWRVGWMWVKLYWFSLKFFTSFYRGIEWKERRGEGGRKSGGRDNSKSVDGWWNVYLKCVQDVVTEAMQVLQSFP